MADHVAESRAAAPAGARRGRRIIADWDILIVTAGSDDQAAEYETQLRMRQKLGLLSGAREVMSMADPGGRRVGSGGSTLHCLIELLNRRPAASDGGAAGPRRWREILSALRVLIIHAGGDSKRLPAYSHCGKIFMPLPGDSDGALPLTLFDRQIGTYLALPAGPPGTGQIVIASGDVLLSFDPAGVEFGAAGLTGLGCPAAPEAAAGHGVYCADAGGNVRRFLQKPTPEQQARRGAVDSSGRSILDIGVMSFDADTAVGLLAAAGARSEAGSLAWPGELHRAVNDHGLDFYREVCCALGSETTFADYVASARAGGSTWPEALLEHLFEALHSKPFCVRVLPSCGFLHFGTTGQLITSGLELLRTDGDDGEKRAVVSINNAVTDRGLIDGENAWVEGCALEAKLSLGGGNVVVGADVDRPVSLPDQACLDIVRGHSRDGREVWFVRCYGAADNFKDTTEAGATLCGRPINEWLAAAGLKAEDVWDAGSPSEKRSLWNGRFSPAATDKAQCLKWLWLFRPERAAAKDKQAYRDADRYSLAEIVSLADRASFHKRRMRIRAEQIRRSPAELFRPDSGFSAADLACVLENTDPHVRAEYVAELLAEARRQHGRDGDQRVGYFTFSRVIHTLGSAVSSLADSEGKKLTEILPGIAEAVAAEGDWLRQLGLDVTDQTNPAHWSERAMAAAFSAMEKTIFASGPRVRQRPRNSLRADEIVWGRAAVRLDLAGGWSDTPPYALEHGGCVINAAVNLNSQPPIQCFARVIPEPVIYLTSIDLGTRAEITELEELLDFGSPTGEFALAKAALALSGFGPEAGSFPRSGKLSDMLRRFGGGIELTTLAAVPKGSGLGASSIVAAVILAVVERIMGRKLSQRELFHEVLRLEQALTTGGGWQDQVGGVVAGAKVITTAAGLVPDPETREVPAEVLDPASNGGRTLLYYTGITRLAKNILQQVVARYLDRDRAATATLKSIRELPVKVAEAMTGRDISACGELLGTAWKLNKKLDPSSTNDAVEKIFARIGPHVHGAKLLGAGGGGFLLMVCKTAEDAGAVRKMLEAEPPNDKARFFDFNVSGEGLVVTVC
ncbi:MAG: fucose pyrophosphorylase domain-containing protein [Planctomycetota bacterium]